MSLPEPTDEHALVQRLLARDEQALGLLEARYGARLKMATVTRWLPLAALVAGRVLYAQAIAEENVPR